MLIFPATLTLVAINFAPDPFRFLGITTLEDFSTLRIKLKGVGNLIILISVSEIDINIEAEFASSFILTKLRRQGY